MIVDVGTLMRALGTFARILLLLAVVGMVIPRVALMVADFLALSGLESDPELHFQDHVQRVIGFRRAVQSPWIGQLEAWYRMAAVQLRRYYYQGE